MTVTKAIPVVKPPSLLDQKSALSRLSKRELEEVHMASTHYPQQQDACEHSSKKSAFQQSASATLNDSAKDVDQTKHQIDHDPDDLLSAFQPYCLSALSKDDASTVPTTTIALASSKESSSVEAPNSDALFDSTEKTINGISADLLNKQKIGNEETPYLESNAITPDENQYDGSTVPTTTIALASSKESSSVEAPNSDALFDSTEKTINGISADLLNKQKIGNEETPYLESNAITPDENQLSTSEMNPLKKKGTLLSGLGAVPSSLLPALNKETITDDTIPILVEGQKGISNLEKTLPFSIPLQESLFDSGEIASSLDLKEPLEDVSSDDETHEATHKMAEGEENNAMIVKPAIARAEVAPVTGSLNSSGADLSESVAAALRVTHLLDELTAAVSRLHLDSSDGKEMTIQLRRDILPETNVHIISTGKQMEVSFLTKNATSNLLLNTHLTTLQNHLNALCPGQVVNLQAQLIRSTGNSQTGSEQDRSRDDLASFDQGNRENSNNDNDTL